MKKITLSLVFSLLIFTVARADEGMWLLPYLDKLNIRDMKTTGLKLTAKEIYDTNNSSLKDAIIHFGGGCTGEIVSKEGLIFTNHHCGYSSIQQVSTMESDYLKSGFWAMNRVEEIPCPGLTIKFVRKIEDVTASVLNDITDNTPEADRTAKIKENTQTLVEVYKSKNEGKTISISSFFGGNQYFVFVTEIFKDIRLVGTPPTSIGKFGGETDNWMWPRHTGDFSVFRVYADKEGKPAEYSAENVPYNTPKFLEISLGGYNEGDFSMIMGFPGRTQRYMTSFEMDNLTQSENPTRIFIRGVRQDILKQQMSSSEKIRLQYSAKYAGSSNYWKNSIGKNESLKKHNMKAKKEAFERDYTAWSTSSSDRTEYSKALPMIKQSVEATTIAAKKSQYLVEAIQRSIEIYTAASIALPLLNDTVVTEERKREITVSLANFYKDYDVATDRLVAGAMLKIIVDSLPPQDRPSFFATDIETKFGGSIDKYLDNLYSTSIFRSQESFDNFIYGDFSKDKLKNDPASKANTDNTEKVMEFYLANETYKPILNEGQRHLIAGTIDMNPNHKYYPDANSTIRLTYGKVLPYSPADGVTYNYYTTLSGIMAKENPKIYEFIVPTKLKELYDKKDFGPYAYKGDVPVCFLTNNDITGGNSGSPVLNSKGQLLGLAFDGNWEAMSSDIMFDPKLQRCISVDIRYVLFIIDKFGGSPIINELKIVN